MYVNLNETMGGLLTRGSVVVCGESCVCVCVCVCVYTNARCYVEWGEKNGKDLDRKGKNVKETNCL